MPRKKKDNELDLLTRQQVADLFRVSTKTVTRRVQARLLPPPLPGAHRWTRKLLREHIRIFEEQAEAAAHEKVTKAKTVKKKKTGRIQGDRIRVTRRGNVTAWTNVPSAKAKR